MATQQIADYDLSVVIPAKNEELRIAKTLRNLHTALDILCIPYEVIEVNDGSGDDTAGVAKSLGAHKVILVVKALQVLLGQA